MPFTQEHSNLLAKEHKTLLIAIVNSTGCGTATDMQSIPKHKIIVLARLLYW